MMKECTSRTHLCFSKALSKISTLYIT